MAPGQYLALLAAGEAQQDQEIAAGVDWLRGSDSRGVVEFARTEQDARDE